MRTDSAAPDQPVDAAAIREMADAVEATSIEQHRAAMIAREIADQLDQGVSWQTISESGQAARLTALMSTGTSRLRDTASKLRRLLARGLADEGLTTRQIGDELGVSHQRVSALLVSRPDS